MQFDPIVLGLAGRGILDRQQAEREALAEREQYMAQVTAYMNQGYDIDAAHSLVQDFYQRQAQMQRSIAGGTQNRWGALNSVVTYTLWACSVLAILIFFAVHLTVG